MLKKQQKWIALLMTLTFAWLLHITAMPLAAVETTEQVSSTSVEQAPGVFEQTGSEWGRVKPRTSPLLLIAAVVALALLYLLIHGIDIDAAPDTTTGTSGTNRERFAKR
ncbi:MAG: hypothetical protein MUP71_12955 [Candidatus Aminicenantes bacterium]|nr:hypothetical protein [Candidatus Aminicenantes bacterium]